MSFHVSHKSRQPASLEKHFPGATVLDLTSKASEPWVKFSPFYPHGNIPVPFSNATTESVEGMWQGLKVFESEDVDVSKFMITNMKGLKRTVRRFGQVLGHRKGVEGETLLPYGEARYMLYLPTYRWMLENCVSDLLDELKSRSEEGESFVFLDYETNTDVNNLQKPLSHAGLVVAYLNGNWPGA
ncbi:MAG: hypothetical protein EP343_10465 [Deltaproteobacteria bacterium]|nr:MAG: hypothetical protein EP343_10465 [Deltaproteobacteria bacterium]